MALYFGSIEALTNCTTSFAESSASEDVTSTSERACSNLLSVVTSS